MGVKSMDIDKQKEKIFKEIVEEESLKIDIKTLKKVGKFCILLADRLKELKTKE